MNPVSNYKQSRMKKFNIELTFHTTVEALNTDSAKKKARKELARYPVLSDVTFCEED